MAVEKDISMLSPWAYDFPSNCFGHVHREFPPMEQASTPLKRAVSYPIKSLAATAPCRQSVLHYFSVQR